MAKQNVNFIQRHVEKFVIGITGLILLATLFLYGIQTPNTATVGGETLAPSDFYQQIDQKAAAAYEKMKSTRQEGSLLDPLPESITAGKLAMPAPVAVAWVSPTPGLTEIAPVQGQVKKIRLADILPPSRPVLTTGRGRATLPETGKLFLTSTGFDGVGPEGPAARGPASPAGFPTPVDQSIKECYWVTVTTAVFNKEQIELFKAAEYHDTRRDFIVAGFEVARQELLPDGQWGPATMVTPYRPKNILPDNLPTRRSEDGSYMTDQATEDLRDNYRTQIQTGTRSNETLRPPFAAYLTNAYRSEWKLPESLPGINIDLSLYVQEVPWTTSFEEPRAARGGRRPERTRDNVRGPGDTEASDRERKKLITQKLEDAKKAFEEKRFLDGEKLLDEVEKDPSVEDQQRLEARRLRIRHENEINAARTTEMKSSAQIQNPDIEPAWVNDTSVLPGRTYRYRLRVLALNNYFGYDIPLLNPADAKKLLLAGAWSEWSTPITVRNDTYLLLDRLAVQPAGQPPLASIEVYHWSNGIWSQGKTEAGIGQRITLTGAGFNFEYDGIIVDIQPNRTFLQRNENPKDNTFSVRQRSSPAITVVNARGEVSEHIATEDRVIKKTIEDEIKAVLEDGPSRGGPSPGPRGPERGIFRGEEDRGGRREFLDGL